MRNGSSLDLSWTPDVQSLVDWFMELDPQAIKPFPLGHHTYITDPVKFCAALRCEIESGLSGTCAKMGTLQNDLRSLKAYFSQKEKAG